MWKINFLPWKEQREKSYRRSCAALVVVILFVAMLVQAGAFYWYRENLIKNKQQENIQTKTLSSLSVKKQCDEQLPELILRAILIVNKSGKVIVENSERERKTWENKRTWEKTCWELVEINTDHVVLSNMITMKKIKWHLGELLK